MIVGGLGFVYFGPPQVTKYITRTAFFKNVLGPELDKIFLINQSNAVAIGLLDQADGDLSYRPSSELVFLPAREGQRLFGGTLVSTGPNSQGTITLLDDSELKLDENSTVLLEIPEDFETTGAMDLQVLSGSVSAERKNAAPTQKQIKINLLNSKGEKREFKREKLVIAAKEPLPPQEPEPTALAPIVPNPLVESSSTAVTNAEQGGLQSLQSNLESVTSESPISLDSLGPTSLSTGELGAEPPVDNREPAAIPELEPEWPSAIEPRLVKKREPKRIVRIRQFDPPPEQNDLTRAIYALNQGRRSLSQRYLARALTRKEYFSENLNTATKFALEGVLENYLAVKDCELAGYFVSNAEKAFKPSDSNQSWMKLLKIKYVKTCSSGL